MKSMLDYMLPDHSAAFSSDTVVKLSLLKKLCIYCFGKKWVYSDIPSGCDIHCYMYRGKVYVMKISPSD